MINNFLHGKLGEAAFIFTHWQTAGCIGERVHALSELREGACQPRTNEIDPRLARAQPSSHHVRR
eukprot:SAG22_NODE_15178_length_355_cov_0.609375_1_plen_64_part_10